jgi:hypothetical protein
MESIFERNYRLYEKLIRELFPSLKNAQKVSRNEITD